MLPLYTPRKLFGNFCSSVLPWNFSPFVGKRITLQQKGLLLLPVSLRGRAAPSNQRPR